MLDAKTQYPPGVPEVLNEYWAKSLPTTETHFGIFRDRKALRGILV